MEFEEKKRLVEKTGLDVNDTEAWHRKFKFHRDRANQRGIGSQLSFEEYLQKATEAKLTAPSQIGLKADQYNLCREGDEGAYTNDSCRFSTSTQNRKEAFENGRHDDAIKAMTGQPRGPSPLIGRSKETHGYLRSAGEKISNALIGRTKDTDAGLAASAEKRHGRTKETHESHARQAEKLTGRTKETHQGYATISQKRSKEFVVTAPDGTEYRGKNMFEFTKEHGLHNGAMSAVARGDIAHYKGWTGRYIEPIE